jgi:hypothetical protein
MKLFTTAAVAVLLSSGMAFAQDNLQTGSTTGADKDPATYLAGPNIQRFYIDETRTTVRPPAQFRAAWETLNETERADLIQACMGNKDNRYNPLCANVTNM